MGRELSTPYIPFHFKLADYIIPSRLTKKSIEETLERPLEFHAMGGDSVASVAQNQRVEPASS